MWVRYATKFDGGVIVGGPRVPDLISTIKGSFTPGFGFNAH